MRQYFQYTFKICVIKLTIQSRLHAAFYQIFFLVILW